MAQTLSQIIRNTIDEVSPDSNGFSQHGTPDMQDKAEEEALTEAEAAIKAWVKELVGEDERLLDLANPALTIGRNQIRAELRTKLDAS